MGLGTRELGSGLSPATKFLCDSVQVILFLYSAVSMSLKQEKECLLLIVQASQQIKRDVSGLTEQAGTDPSLRKAVSQSSSRQ